jgi:hypothetical protein
MGLPEEALREMRRLCEGKTYVEADWLRIAIAEIERQAREISEATILLQQLNKVLRSMGEINIR